ncbi:conserved hypothetical protein [Photobacterium leiognathi lrivu.4.1]|uniref:Uncharacterized protein n=1 Tax=Photobacterium leiognathi lrivu.4.1 TaxID=1248232 RepID=V5ES44_PHOLE|nr:hypothetical protein [Photobacterium leiognathi]GAD32591.1 conserved hypothetical protein [Photobacterium leiognathi lrivu.4.1]
MYLKLLLSFIALVTFSPATYSLCFIDGVPDTQSVNRFDSQRLEGHLHQEFFSEPQLGSTFGELEHSFQQPLFAEAWPSTAKLLKTLPAASESVIATSAILNRLGQIGSATLEVLGPVGDAFAVEGWAENMVSTFSKESSTRLDKIASIFSIVPLVGDELNMLSNDIKYFAAKEKIEEFESQTHYVFNDHHPDFHRFHHKKEDAIQLINQYDDHVNASIKMYIDQLLLAADTEYRRIAAGYDRQLVRQMTRMDLEHIKVYGHISGQSNLNHPLCSEVEDNPAILMNCVKSKGLARIQLIINQLSSSEFNQLHLKLHKVKRSLVQTALENLQEHKEKLRTSVIVRAKQHIPLIYQYTGLNRRILEERARMSGLREYAKANWNLDYLSDEQIRTATFEVSPARECWGIPSVYLGGIQASLDACKDSGPLYDTYHLSKDQELVAVIRKSLDFDVESYVEMKVNNGWESGLLRTKLGDLAYAYVVGQLSNRRFETLVTQLSSIKVLSYQTTLTEYLNSQGLDGNDPEQRKDWYQLSRWYELLLTERPSGGALSIITQYERFHAFIKPVFENTITAAYIRDIYYSIPYPSMYSGKNLQFYSPIMAKTFDNVIVSSDKNTLQRSLNSAVSEIMEKVTEVKTANELHYLLGDLALYAQIAQHQQSEVHVLTTDSYAPQLFNSSLSVVNRQYLNEAHLNTISQQVMMSDLHALWQMLSHVGSQLSQGKLDLAITQLGDVIRNNDMTMLPYIHEILVQELEEIIELQIKIES